MPEDYAEMIALAATMHDIGKIGIPDRILLKPAKLTADEWLIMRQHTTYGAEILSDSNSAFIRLGERIASTHHEWWDGSGYPGGLKGPDIPIEGRIAAVADVFDALTSRRPYKQAMPMKQAFEVMAGERGTHFDPAVVDAFFGIKERLTEIRSLYEDAGSSHLRQVTGDPAR